MNIDSLKQSIKAMVENFSSVHKEQGLEIVEKVISLLDQGKIRVASYKDGEWETHAWVKQAILLYFRLRKMEEYKHGIFSYRDKIPLKTNFEDLNVRVVPPATARYGSFMEANVVLMPSYVNIGAWIGSRTMIDTWATVGSCAQIGCDVHISGGVGIGGVLEPVAASPVIIEDGAFIGSRCIIVEGVKIGKEAVLSANCSVTASTPVIDTRGKVFKTYKGYIPPRSVVLPGTKEKEVEGGKIFTSCLYIIGERKESTDRKTSLNQVLREFNVSA